MKVRLSSETRTYVAQDALKRKQCVQQYQCRCTPSYFSFRYGDKSTPG